MTGCFGPAARIAPLVVLLAALAGCEDAPQAPPATGAAAAQPAQAPGGVAPATVAAVSPQANAADDAGQTATALLNDPSAPSNTPLCGIAAQETNALSRQLLSRQYAEAGQCAAYACYDAATATYIGADGYRHVCR